MHFLDRLQIGTAPPGDLLGHTRRMSVAGEVNDQYLHALQSRERETMRRGTMHADTA